MKHRFLRSALPLILLAAVFAFSACGKGKTPAATEAPSAAPDDVFTTPDASLFELGENGRFEDQYITANWYPTLKLSRVVMNYAEYEGTTLSGDRLLFSYTVDDMGSFAGELSGHDFDSYQKLLFSQNSYYYLKDFGYVTVDGHETLRAVYEYAPDEEPDKKVYVLQYAYNVNGWIMSVAYTSLSPIPAECEDTLNSVRFKAGY